MDPCQTTTPHPTLIETLGGWPLIEVLGYIILGWWLIGWIIMCVTLATHNRPGEYGVIDDVFFDYNPLFWLMFIPMLWPGGIWLMWVNWLDGEPLLGQDPPINEPMEE